MKRVGPKPTIGLRQRRVLWPVLLLIPSLALLSQTGQQSEFKISTDVEMVLLDVGVRDAKGGYVAHLPQSAFHVDEDGVPQTITAFSNADVPVEAGLVMDASGSMRTKRAEVNAAGLAFVERSNPQDQIFVLNFNDKVWDGLPEGVPFSDNVEVLRAALGNERPQGRTVLYDAIAVGLHHLELGNRGRKTLVLVTDGGDNHSMLDLATAMKLIEESHTTIYTVGLYDNDDPYRNPGVLRKIAAVSGGECFLPKKYDEVVSICEKIAKDIRYRYTIGYVPSRSAKTGIRKLRVTASAADRGKLVVQSRTSYSVPERLRSN